MRRINHCLNHQLISICQRTLLIEHINSKIKAFLPSSLHDHCHVGSFNRGSLVLVVKDTALSTQLRYALPELRDKLRTEAGFYQLTSIKITLASTDNNVTVNKRSSTLTNNARATIQAASEECSYLPLKVALQQLAE